MFVYRCCKFAISCVLLAAFATAAHAQNFKFLEVKVLDENGKPMPEVSVDIKMDGLDFPMPTDDLGMIALNVSASETPVELRVRHEGYQSQRKRWRRAFEVPEEFSFKMERGKPGQGTVFDPEGQPVAGALIYHAPPNESLTFQNGLSPKAPKQKSAVTDEQGKFTLPHQPEGSTIVCLSDAGWSQFVKTEQQNGEQLEINLAPWVQVRVVSKLAPEPTGELVGLHFVNGLGKDRGNVTWQYEGRTKAGVFVCDRVIPGTVMAYRVVSPQLASPGRRRVKHRSHGIIATLRQGQQQEITLGTAKRAATGKLYKPVAYDGEIKWDAGYVALTENNAVDLVLRTAIFEYGKLLSQSNVYRPEQRVPPSGVPNYLVRYLATVEADGSFEIPSVPPGQYKLSAVLPAQPQDNPNRRDTLKLDDLPVTLLADGEADFDVGEHILNE